MDLYPYGAAYAGTSFDVETYLANVESADEWEIVKNDSARVRKPSDVGKSLVFSARVSNGQGLTQQLTHYIFILVPPNNQL